MISGPLGGAHDEPGGGPDDGGRGGWIPPEDRLWRHPSELHQPQLRTVGAPAYGHRRVTTLAVGTTAVAAIAIGLLLLVNASAGRPPSDVGTVSISTAAVTPCCRLPAAFAQQAEEAMVSLQSAGGKPLGCGVVLGDGDLVATTTGALGGARRLRAVAATGRSFSVSLLASDPVSGVALLRLPLTLPAARVGGEQDLDAGSPAMAVAMTRATAPRVMAAAGGAPRTVWTSGTVVALGAPLSGSGRTGTGRSSGMAAIVIQGSSVPDMPGEPLVSLDGKVVGILATAAGPDREFLPMPLVVGVIDDLDTMGQVRHGWLDVTDTTPSGTTIGALVVSVDAGGASSEALRPGDLIVGVDGTPVRSSADLRSMLYVMPPGTTVTIDVERGDRLVRAAVALSSSP